MSDPVMWPIEFSFTVAGIVRITTTKKIGQYCFWSSPFARVTLHCHSFVNTCRAIGGLHWRHRKWIKQLSPDCCGLQDRYAPYVIEHHNQSPDATFWSDTNYLSRITNVWIPWQQRCLSRIIGDKIDVWNVNLKPFFYRHPLKVDERWPRTPMRWNEV